MKTKKYKVKVLYGSEACDYADEHTFSGAVRKVKKGELEGDYHEYEFDTEEDRDLVKDILEDAEGWEDHYSRYE